MNKEISIADARSHFSAWVRSAEHGDPIVITRRGKRVAVLIPATDYERLERLRAAGPQAGLVSLAGGWEGSADLADELDALDRTASRSVPDLG